MALRIRLSHGQLLGREAKFGKGSCCCGEGRLLLVVFIDSVTHGGWWLFVVRSCSEGFLDTPATTLKGQWCQLLSRVAEGMVDW